VQPDYATPYGELRDRVTALVRRHPDDVDAVAPATPEWRVRDVLSHMAGVCDDVVNGNLDGVATDPWTAAQVDKRRDWTVDQILEEWAAHGPAIAQTMTDFPISEFGQMVFDAVIHEHDIRGAFREPGARDSSAIATAFDWGTDALAAAHAGNPGAFTFVTEAGSKTVGEGDQIFTLHISRFEFIRAMTGRRSVDQMRALRWEGEPKLEWFGQPPLFHPPAEDLIE
jgi:uncharacterized protein (TIGR03083 family)